MKEEVVEIGNMQILFKNVLICKSDMNKTQSFLYLVLVNSPK